MKLYKRFILEPRSCYGNTSGSSSNCYLVVYDKKEKHYVYDNPKTRSYAKFKDSEKAFRKLIKLYPECE